MANKASSPSHGNLVQRPAANEVLKLFKIFFAAEMVPPGDLLKKKHYESHATGKLGDGGQVFGASRW